MRHGKANALDIEFCDALAARFDELLSADAKAVVLTGQGRIFSAGVDLIRLERRAAPIISASSCRRCTGFIDAVFFHPKPVVAAINGHAIAGGCVLACCADRRIMARDAGRIGVTELLVGVPFPALAFEIVRFAVPPRYLAEFTLGGATYATDAALQRGWIDEVAEPDALMDAMRSPSRASLPRCRRRPSRRPSRRSARPSTERMAHSGRGDRHGGHRNLDARRQRSATSATTSRGR